jgi:hypothetical protein
MIPVVESRITERLVSSDVNMKRKEALLADFEEVLGIYLAQLRKPTKQPS